MCICTSWGFADTRDEFEINADYVAQEYTIGIKVVNKIINSVQKFEILRKVKNFDDILPAIQQLRISELSLENMNDEPKINQNFSVSIEDKSMQDGISKINKQNRRDGHEEAEREQHELDMIESYYFDSAGRRIVGYNPMGNLFQQMMHGRKY